jgi:hypothetical protein
MRARTTATGWLIIRVVVSGDEESLIAFQPIAEEALSIADEYARGTSRHLLDALLVEALAPPERELATAE